MSSTFSAGGVQGTEAPGIYQLSPECQPNKLSQRCDLLRLSLPPFYGILFLFKQLYQGGTNREFCYQLKMTKENK